MRKFITTCAIAGMAAVAGFGTCAAAKAGEVRTLSMYHVHTKESLTVTYKMNGRYVPEAMSRINHLLRDWRKDQEIRIDPEAIDLMWELHEDLGSKAPVNIICGYRSAETNSLLKRIGRNVARRSQHIAGRAIDLFFPDVSTEKIRNSALVREVGGVGFYPRSGDKGFVHIDTGSVRHWPRISEQQFAQIKDKYRSTIGARMSRPGNTLVATLDSSTPAAKAQEASRLAAIAGAASKVGLKVTAAAEESESPMFAEVPKPRPRPIEVAFQVAQRMQVQPASAPVPRRNFAEQISGADRAQSLISQSNGLDRKLLSNFSAKGSLVAEVREGIAEGVPLIKPIETSLHSGDIGFGEAVAEYFVRSFDAIIRRDGYPEVLAVAQPAGPSEVAKGLTQTDKQDMLEFLALPIAVEQVAVNSLAGLSNQSAKGDMLEVNRTRKGDFGLAELAVRQDMLIGISAKSTQ